MLDAPRDRRPMPASGSARRKTDTVTLYLRTVRMQPRLERELEDDLASRAASGCEPSRRALVESNLGFVIRVAKKYRNLGVSFEDLIAEGNLGLLEAALRFDPGRGARFSTYATWWIRKKIVEALAAQSSLIRVPFYHFQRRRARHTEPRSSADGADADRPAAAAPLRPGLVPLDEPAVDGGRPRIETIADLAAADPERDALRSEVEALVRRALLELSPQERSIIEARYGLDGEQGRTLNEIGALWGLTGERVRQIEAGALGRLRRRIGWPSRRRRVDSALVHFASTSAS